MSGLQEAALLLILAGSVVFIDSVWETAPVLRWAAASALALILACRVRLVYVLRRTLGSRRLVFEPLSRRLLDTGGGGYGGRTWSFDLRRPPLPAGPLVLPGLAFLVLICVQLVPVPPATAFGRVATISAASTARGLGFVAFALLLHVFASATLDRSDARRRFIRGVAVLGLVVSGVKLFRLAFSGALQDGFFARNPASDNIFLNRNHFGTYMLLVVPLALGLLASAARAHARRVGAFADLRTRFGGLAYREGPPLLYATLMALACLSALIATVSRGALLAFAGSLVLAAAAARKRFPVMLWFCVLALIFTAVFWFGLERLDRRFAAMRDDAPGRTWVWMDTLRRMDGRWITGYGFNTFEVAMSRATPWQLPRGATPWTSPYETELAAAKDAGIRTGPGPGLGWYGHAHNDYLQVLAETGLVGLLLAGWAAWRVLAATRNDPWLLAAISGVLLHSFVDFGLQVPAVASLFAAIAAMTGPSPPNGARLNAES